MKKIAVLLSVIFTSLNLMAADPDFVYPQTTLSNAEKHYESAIKSPSATSSGITMIKSLLEIAGATAAIDPDSVANVIPKVDRAIGSWPDGSCKSLMMTIKAELLNTVYTSDRWKYDRVETPDTPLPADITEWNGNQFRDVITRTADDAFAMAAKSQDALSDYSQVVKADRLSLRYFPTVASFVALKAINLTGAFPGSHVADILRQMTALSHTGSNAYFYWTFRQLQRDYSDWTKRGDFNAECKKLYDDNKDNEAAGYILARYLERVDKEEAPDWAIPALKSYIKRFPDFWDINSLKNRLAVFTQPEVSLECKPIVAPDKTFGISISYSYATTIGYKIYNISETSFKNNSFSPDKSKFVASVAFDTDPSVASADTTVTAVIGQQGYYAVMPVVNGKSSRHTAYFFRCAPYVPLKINAGDFASIITADYESGAPLEGAAVTENAATKQFKLGKTDKDGIIAFKPYTRPVSKQWNYSTGRSSYDITYAGSTLNYFDNYISSTTQQSDRRYIKFDIFTDRSLYHPGDTVRWSAIAYYSDKEGNSICSDQSVKVTFYNPNNQLVDSATVTSDSFGRVYGSFVAPTDGLTGSCAINTQAVGKDSRAGYARVEVSDFKLPTFRIEKVDVSRDVPAAGEVTLISKALTYSGMPVSGAKVEATIMEATRWRWFSPSRRLGTVSGVTDADGEFRIVVGDSLLSQSADKCYIADITVTSGAGEAQQASASFTTGKPYYISFISRTSIFNTDEKIAMPFAAYDASGKEVAIAVRWWINPQASGTDPSKAVASGECMTDKKSTIDLSKLSAGTWTISAAPVDPAQADSVAGATELTTYSVSRNLVPDEDLIFTPDFRVTASRDGEFDILFGVPNDGTYVYHSFAAGDGAPRQGVRRYDAGFHHLKLRLPEGQSAAQVVLMTVRDGKTAYAPVRVKVDDLRALVLEGSSMRDRLTSGSAEQWTLKLNDKDGNPQAGAMIATMFNSALNAIAPYSMPESLQLYRIWVNQEFRYVQECFPETISGTIKRLRETNLGFPDFYPAINVSSLRQYKFRAMSRANTAAGVSDMILVNEDEGYDMAMVGSASVTESAKITAPEESAEEYEVDGNPAHEPEEFEYRDSEVLQAFWMPGLTFNDKGETTLSFTVPDANTSWTMNAFAWTDDLRSAKMIREFVSSKPVMVQPNLPRFLRTGDTARVLATVYNNSDSAAVVTSVIEIFDISSGNVRSTVTTTDTIAAAGSAIVATTVTAPDNASAVGYRVRSTLGRFTDGEQSFIPVEAATSDVIESEVFYLNPGEADYSMTLPKGKDMQSTLDYTDNPAWNIIRQLPGLAADDASTSTGAARQLFGAATAAGIVKSYPAIAEVLRAWSEDPDSKALVSRLGQNDELKAAVLASTPWVQAAASDNERMARLSLLLDNKATARSINSSLATLRKLQRADGGWAWGSWADKASPWATSFVLQDLARLNAAGYLPADKELSEMIGRAIAYYESTLTRDIRTDQALTYITALLPGYKLGLEGKRVVNATLQAMMTEWKSASTWGKAMDAIILEASGYPNVATEIIGSLRQFAVRSADKGTSFPSVNNVNDYADLLYAFARIEPTSPVIDGMRQWLVIRSEATDDLGSYDPTRLILAFTSCGSDWLPVNDDMATITADGKAITTDEAERATGHIVTPLPKDVAGKTLSIVRHNAAAPAYGAVISRYVAKSTEVKASSCPDLSIEKRITVLRDGKWQYTDEVRLGEQVRVLLTIKAKRDLEYVTVIDQRPASFEPVEQLPGWVWNGGAGFYRENRNTETRLFIDYLRKGTYQITVEMTASVAGEFTSGIATVQSQLAPAITAHSAGVRLTCE